MQNNDRYDVCSNDDVQRLIDFMTSNLQWHSISLFVICVQHIFNVLSVAIKKIRLQIYMNSIILLKYVHCTHLKEFISSFRIIFRMLMKKIVIN